PGTDDERFKHPMRGYDYEWAHNVAQQQAQTHRPTDETVDQLHEEVEQLRSQARRATERAESLQRSEERRVGKETRCRDATRRRHTRSKRDWSSDVCSSDLAGYGRRTLQTPHARLRLRMGPQCCSTASPNSSTYG